MDCPNGENLGLYVTNDLGGDERLRIEGHLPECAPCSDVVARLRQAQTAIHDDLPPVDDERWALFENTFLARARAVKAEGKHGRSTRRLRMLVKRKHRTSSIVRLGMVLPALAAAAVLLAAALGLFSSGPAVPHETRTARADSTEPEPREGATGVASHEVRAPEPSVHERGPP